MQAILDNTKTRPHVVIIGGGITGAGIARDASLRGFKVTLVEQDKLGSGTTGRFHGILHSGARYAVNDSETAADCYRENQILRRIAPSAITDTGGIFLALTPEEATYADTIMQACEDAGIPVIEISRDEAARREPNATPEVLRAFTVPDAYVDGKALIELNMRSSTEADEPATLLTGHTVTELRREGDSIKAVVVHDEQADTTKEIACDYVVNACGVWAGAVANMASLELPMVYDKGTMIVFKLRLNNTVLNRCRPEDDGDLLVPHGDHSIMGTTARPVSDPNDNQPTQEEIDLLIREGTAMVPAIRNTAITSVFAGVRPLFDSGLLQTPGTTTRSLSRSFHVIDHESDGVSNFISVIGGKVTIYRLMAEAAVDKLCEKSGLSASCTTADIKL